MSETGSTVPTMPRCCPHHRALAFQAISALIRRDVIEELAHADVPVGETVRRLEQQWADLTHVAVIDGLLDSQQAS